MLQKLVIIGFLVIIIYNLGAGLYYMMVDKGDNDRMVRSLTWRIGLSIALIAVIGIGIWTGWIQPHDIGQ
jgi:succinate dehydrogenase/fumarate reductase cytochrome b subunit